jgi:hypothetical protein
MYALLFAIVTCIVVNKRNAPQRNISPLSYSPLFPHFHFHYKCAEVLEYVK